MNYRKQGDRRRSNKNRWGKVLPKNRTPSSPDRRKKQAINSEIQTRREAHDGCTGKRKYDDYESATRAAKKSVWRSVTQKEPVMPLFIYVCYRCGLYHLSKKRGGPQTVARVDADGVHRLG